MNHLNYNYGFRSKRTIVAFTLVTLEMSLRLPSPFPFLFFLGGPPWITHRAFKFTAAVGPAPR